MKRLLSMTALGSLLTALFFVAVQPAWAGSVDERIQALEQELAQLKTDQSQLQGEQMELRKEATAAEAQLPEFRYRQRSGLRIRAADRSWEITFHYVFHGRIAFFPDAQDADNRPDGTYFGRRNRPGMTMKFNDGFYEILWRHDADAGDFAIQDSTFFVHFERVHPWLPYFQIGMDNSATMNWHDSNWSSSTSGHLERSMLVRGNGINTGGSHTGFGLVWDDVAVGPGSYTLEWHYIQAIGGSDGVGTRTDRKDFYVFAGAKPCEKCKSKWVEGIDLGVGAAFGNVDSRAGSNGTNRRLRIRDHQQVADDSSGGNQRITLFDSGSSIGDGMHTYVTPGFGWRIGPYRFRSAAGFDGWDGEKDGAAGRIGGRMFSIAHELFVWSPKGFMTGSSNGPHSIMISWLFERDDAWCRESRGLGTAPCGSNAGQFSRNHVLLRELDLWWFIQRNVSVGFAWMWYDAANVRTADQRNIGCSKTGSERVGKDCDWHSLVLALRVGF